MPNSLTRVLSHTFGYSPRLPVSVCGTGTHITHVEVFLGSMIRVSLCRKTAPHRISELTARICLGDPPTCLDQHFQSLADLSLLRHPIVQTKSPKFRNINRIPIAYGFRPRLRGRLTLRGLALRRNPWAFGESVSHTLYRYSCQHSHFRYLQGLSREPLHRLTERSATTPVNWSPQLRCMALAPVHLRRRTT